MPRSDMGEFKRRADDIITEWLMRKKRETDAGESANAWFKREAYRFLRDYISSGRMALFDKIARLDRRPHKLVSEATENPFKLGLLAMFVDESISRSDRHVFGNQMLYAHRHDVPAEFLNGFIAVSGKPAAIAQKLKDGSVEPGFEDRVGALVSMTSQPTRGC